MTDTDRFTPFFGEFENSFLPVANPTLTINLTGPDRISSGVGQTGRSKQLPFNQLVESKQFGPLRFALYNQLMLSKDTNWENRDVTDVKMTPAHKLQLDAINKLNTHRSTIDYLTTVNDKLEVGVGLVVPGSILVDGDIKNRNLGVHFSARNDKTSGDLQVLVNGKFNANVVGKILSDMYVGVSLSNMMNVEGNHGSVFVSSIPEKTELGKTFMDNFRNNSKWMVGFNSITIEEGLKMTSEHLSLFGQHSLPLETRLGNALVSTGLSVDLTGNKDTSLTFGGKHEIFDSGASVSGSIDFSPTSAMNHDLQSACKTGTIGIEYNKNGFYNTDTLGAGLYLQVNNMKDRFEYTPKLGINMKF